MPVATFGSLSFLFTVKTLVPNFRRERRQGTTQDWKPPTSKDAYTVESISLYRWAGGNVELLEKNVNMSNPPTLAVPDGKKLEVLNAGTIFVQNHRADVLNAMTRDATETNATGNNIWRPICFDKIKFRNLDNQYYSRISQYGGKANLAASASSGWLPDLLPQHYESEEPNRINKGLVGPLPLLLSLAVLAGKSEHVETVLPSCVKPHQWVGNIRSTNGRSEKLGLLMQQALTSSAEQEYRGAVVTVYNDPKNPGGSSKILLEKLEGTEFGAFYR
ncbi:uncharacterized protein KY384_005212 [Bacidia gigantensis]|uniref:uncharacterized protein n=1 Tax=Bacidia gigantensis TaxID=2732470 RepID=UPI001D04D06E|nr:uncharacterized protein KY384_005212 [Bacidia gigantensis]KAG8529731.1 hypothetical protein KY384_005212 [Bacidia gigantensis]